MWYTSESTTRSSTKDHSIKFDNYFILHINISILIVNYGTFCSRCSGRWMDRCWVWKSLNRRIPWGWSARTCSGSIWSYWRTSENNPLTWSVTSAVTLSYDTWGWASTFYRSSPRRGSCYVAKLFGNTWTSKINMRSTRATSSLSLINNKNLRDSEVFYVWKN